MPTKFKIHLVSPRLGLTFCHAKIRGNTTRKIENTTCKNCIRAHQKYEAVMGAISMLSFRPLTLS